MTQLYLPKPSLGTPLADNVYTKGLIASYPFTSAREVIDYTPNKNHGTVTGAAWGGQGLEFVAGDFVNFGSPAILDTANSDFSVCFWVRWDAGDFLLTKRKNHTNFWNFRRGAGPNFSCYLELAGTGGSVNPAILSFLEGDLPWHFIVMTVKAGEIVWLYDNGKASNSASLVGISNIDSGGWLGIAKTENGAGGSFAGAFRSLYFYNRVLTSTEIQQIYMNSNIVYHDRTLDSVVNSWAGVAPQITMNSPVSPIWTEDNDVDFDITIDADTPTAYALIDWDDSLVGWYRGNGNANDSSSQANHASFSGTYTGGPFGKAFDGATAYIPAGPVNFSKSDSFTWSCWVNKDYIIGSIGIIGFGSYYRLMWHGSGRWEFRLGQSPDNWRYGCIPDSDVVGQWRHLVLTYNAETQIAKLYLNGGQEQTSSMAGADDWYSISSMKIYAGPQQIGDLAIFNRVISAAEVAALYDATVGDFETTFADLLSLDEHSYTVNVVDNAARLTTESDTITVDVPNSAPYVTLASPLSPIRSTSSSQTFTVSAMSTNIGVDIHSATLWLGPPGSKVEIETKYFSNPTEGYNQLDFSQTGLDDGTYAWNVWVEDADSNGGWAGADSLLVIGRTSYYVATDGNDGDTGDIGDPFLTIQQFADIALPGDTCFIREGTYRETITPAISGHAEASITYKSYPGEAVIVSGADILSGSWTVHSGSVYKRTSTTDLGLGKNQVFVNGKIATWARYPKAANYSGRVDDYDQHLAETLEITSGSYAGSAATVGCTGLTEANGYWDGALIHAIWVPRYHSITGIVDSYTVGELSVTLDMNGYGTIDSSGAFYLTNSLNCLTAANEWFLDTDTDTLYLRTSDSADPALSVIEIKTRKTAFDLEGVSYTNIEDMSIFAADIIMDAESSYNILDNLDIKYVTHYSVIDEGSMGVGQMGVRDSGIVLDGDYNVIKYSVIDHSAGNGVSLIGDYCSILTCTISNINYTITECAGVHLGSMEWYVSGENNIINGNTIFDAGRGLINHTDSPNLKITNNDLSGSRSSGWTWDLGAIYCHSTDGVGTEIAYNRIHDCRSRGIYLDNTNWNFNIHHNIVTDLSWVSGVQMGIHLNQQSINHVIAHNTLYGCWISTNEIEGTKSMAGTRIINNICIGFKTSGGAKFTGYPDSDDDAVLESNIITDTDEPWLSGGELLYVDYEDRDFRLRSTSPAVDAGQDEGYAQDIAGHPIVPPPDIGAYEFFAVILIGMKSAGKQIKSGGK